MKKLIAMMMALMMMLGCCAALAEEGDSESFPMPEEAAVFEGIWACDRANAEVIWEEAGFRVAISWSSSASETTVWDYSCYFNAEDRSLVSVPESGTKIDYVYREDGEVESSTPVYEDGEATFTLDEENHLIWKDVKEDAGKDLKFVFISPLPPMDLDV